MLRRLVAAFLAAGCAVSAWSQVSVGGNGQPSYSQPIAIPPGVSGMAPQLALLYSGGGVNGPLGDGWSIQGVSAITHCAADKVIDGAAVAVTYSVSDKLCLDGQRLIPTDAAGVPLPPAGNDSLGLTSPAYREYRTAKDSYTRIRAYGQAGGLAANGPLYFKAWTKAGQVYEYGEPPSVGATPKSLVLAQGKTAVMAWAVARVSDAVGNYMDYLYESRTVAFGSGPSAPTAGVEWNVTSILYTGKTGAGQRAPYNKVQFDYMDRPDPVDLPRDRAETYHAGSKNVSVRRLKRIRAFAGPALVRTTELTYETAPVTGRSRMTQFRECFGESATSGEPGTKCAPWAKFSYANSGGQAITMKSNFNLSNLRMLKLDGSYGILTADFNGDGRTDIFRWAAESSSENELHYSDGDGTFTKETNLNLPHLLFSMDGCFHSMVADMNVDGLPDIVRFAGAKKLDGSTCTVVGNGGNTLTVFTNNGGGGFTPATVQSKSLAGVVASMAIPRQISTKTSKTFCMDALPRGAGGNGRRAGVLVGEDPICNNPITTNGWTAGATFYIFDVNGDGRPDIVTSSITEQIPPDPTLGDELPSNACPAGTTCTRVFLQDAAKVMVEVNTNVKSETLYSDPGKAADLQFQRHLADIDGDGFADLASVGKQSSAGGWRNSGASDTNGDGQLDFVTFSKLNNSGLCEREIDFNGDGRRDCLSVMAGEPTFSALYVSKGYVPTGSSTDKVASFNLNNIGHPLLSDPDIDVGSRYGFFTTDLNSDGREDIFRWHDDKALNRLYYSLGDGSFRLDPDPVGYTTQFKHSDGKFDVVMADFMGDGSPTMLRLSEAAPNAGVNYSITNNLYVRTSPGAPDRLLTVTSPMGLVTRLEYSSVVHDAAGRYQSDRGTSNKAEYPLVDLAGGWSVVTTLESDSGVGTSTTKTEFQYRGLKASVDGSGAFGFRNMRTQTLAANGTDYLTTSTDYLLGRPYAGLARSTETRLASLSGFDAAATLSRTGNKYCDKTSGTAPGDAQEAVPCPSTAKVQRPYLRESIESGVDLDGVALPTVTTTNTFDDFGNPTVIVTNTKGTFDQVIRSYSKTTTNNFDPPITTGDKWILGRLRRATVDNQVPNLGLVPSAGTAPNATKTTGVGLP